MTGFRPALWPTVMTVPALAALVALGTWQVERLAWKEALIAERAAGLAAPPLALPREVEDPAGLAFRRVTVRGRFRHEAEFHLLATSRTGRAGYHVITPLVRGDGGATVLIDRGWVPYERKDPETRAAGQLDGTVPVTGIVRGPGAQGRFVPDNRPEENTWYWRDLDAMAARAGPDVRPLLVEAGPAPNPGGYPLGGQTRTELANRHLGYALTWYALAAALAVIYVVYHRQRGSARGP